MSAALSAIGAGCLMAATTLAIWTVYEIHYPDRQRPWRAPTLIALFSVAVGLMVFTGASQ